MAEDDNLTPEELKAAKDRLLEKGKKKGKLDQREIFKEIADMKNV